MDEYRDLLTVNRKDGLGYFRQLMEIIDADSIDSLVKIAETTIKYLSASKADRPASLALQALEEQWYRELGSGAPDFRVYEAPEYLAELWACWFVYSRRYLVAIEKLGLFDQMPNAGVVVDLGNGIGITTAVLAQLYPRGDIFGTNIADTVQTRLSRLVGEAYGFAVVGSPRQVLSSEAEVGVERAELVFASEYFEHFQRPVEHLVEVLDALRPRSLFIANSFGAKAVGHFDRYGVDDDLVDGKLASRLFWKKLRERGYCPVETGFWNNRPAYWILDGEDEQS